jgi:Xaa-Pro aminopeptidase
MRYKALNRNFFTENRNTLIDKLKENSLVLVFASDEFPKNGDQTFSFRQNSDTYYLSGLDQEEIILAICPNHFDASLREVLFIKKVDKTQVIWYGKKIDLEKAKKLSGVESVFWMDEYKKMLPKLMNESEHIYLWKNNAPKFTTEVPYKALRMEEKLKKDYPNHQFEELAPLTTELRLIKKKEELVAMKKAVEITGKAYHRLLKKLKPGMMEYEVEANITYEYIRNGAQGHAYAPIVASGANACILHYEENDQECKDGDLLLLDFGAEYAYYAADCSRTIPINGKFSPRQAACYQAVLDVYKEAHKLYIPETTIDDINMEVNKMMEAKMIELGLFSAEDVKNQDKMNPLFTQYFMHGTSHFIGLDVHDVGSKQTPLKEGMVLTCEPGLYIEEEGIGIRIETDILITENGPVDLMANFPVEIEEIEELMR